MLHFKVTRVLPKEQYARTVVNKFFTYGASAHRLGNSTQFIVLIPVKRPERREVLLKMLVRNSLGEEFELVDVTSFIGGPQFVEVSEAEADELLKSEQFVKNATTEPVSDNSEFDYVRA